MIATRPSPRRPWRPQPGRRLGRPLLIVALVLLFGLGGLARAEVRASLDRDQVYAGDSLTLIIETDGPDRGERPDLTPLERDFEVGGMGIATETRILNARRFDSTRFRIALTPRATGQLQVPALRLGDQQTSALRLQVDPLPEGGLGIPGDDLFLELDLDADLEHLVVQQQVPLLVRAYSARPLLDYELRLPDLEGAGLSRIGRETGHLTSRNGRQYRVIEWRFSLNPERSGELRIPSLVFVARLQSEPAAGRDPFADSFGDERLERLFRDPALERMLGAGPWRSGFPMFDRGEPARAQSQALTLTVAPSPDEFAGPHWLPAQALGISDDWAARPPVLAVGEPATRTLTITARGLAGTQLPALEVPMPAGVRTYPPRVERETRSDGNGLIGISRQQVTLIPGSGGEIELPALRLPWWDTNSNQQREAVVPALRLQVAGPVSAPTAPAPALPGTIAGADAASASDAARDAPAAQPAAQPAVQPTGGAGRRGWWVLALVLLVALGWWQRRWLPGLPRQWWGRLRQARLGAAARTAMASTAAEAAVPVGTRQTDAVAARAAVQAACSANDAGGAARALLVWAAARWPAAPPVNLAALAAGVARGGAEIRALERFLYAPRQGDADWDGAPLWAALHDGLDPAEAPRPPADPLVPLYPTRHPTRHPT